MKAKLKKKTGRRKDMNVLYGCLKIRFLTC